MKKTKSIKLSATYHIKPKQLRDALAMTRREYRKTPEYQEEAKKRLKEFLKNWESGPQFKRFKEMAAAINEQMNQINSSGLPHIIKSLQEQFSSILEDSQPKEIFISPRANNPTFLSPEIIEEISQKSAEKIKSILNKKTGGTQKIVLFLTEDGDLYRKPKERCCYRMKKGMMRLKILRCLTDRYKSTEDIMIETGNVNEKATRKSIGEIRSKTNFFLKLKKDLIESKPYSGYRINPLYTIKYLKNRTTP